jgi:chemotaxis protein MotA
MSRISIVTFIGVVFSLTMVAIGVLEITGDIDIINGIVALRSFKFLNLPSLLIIVGGILNAIFIMYPGRYVWGSIKSVFYIFLQSKVKRETLNEDIKLVLAWSDRIKKNKLDAYVQIQDEQKGEIADMLFSLISTNYSTNDIRNFAETNIEETYNRRLINVEVLNTMAGSAPAFGMFGTIFGLIVMLGELDSPSNLGPGLATALLTTLYGISLAHLFFYPIARKLRNIAQIDRFREYLILEGVLMLQEGKSPFYIQDKLNAFLRRDYSTLIEEMTGKSK